MFIFNISIKLTIYISSYVYSKLCEIILIVKYFLRSEINLGLVKKAEQSMSESSAGNKNEFDSKL